MRDPRYLRTQPVKAEAARYQVVSELDPIFGIIEEDYTAEVARTSVFDEDDSHAVLAKIATALASRE